MKMIPFLAAAVVPAVAVGLATAARAGDIALSPQAQSDLASAVVPVAGNAPEAGRSSHGGGGLRCWMGQDARAADPFDDFARPVTNLSFHHPFIWNEIRPVFVQRWFPEDSLVEGGDLRAYAMQIHAKITDDIQFTAYKDGWTDFNPDAALAQDHGWVDLAAGFKFKVWEDRDAPAIFTLGAGYETTTGDEEVLQGGDGDLFDLFGSYARKVGPFHLIATAGLLVPLDSDEAVRTLHWHAHVDLPVTAHLNALVEVNAFHYLSDGEANAGLGPAVPLGFEGYDYSNLGADDVDHNDVATVGVGLRWFTTDDVSFGAAWEWPITDREDVIDQRLTIDRVLRF